MQNSGPILDRKVGLGLIFAIILQVIAFTWFLAMLNSRVTSLENWKNMGDRFTQQDGQILLQKIEYNSAFIVEVRQGIKDIYVELKEIRETVANEK